MESCSSEVVRSELDRILSSEGFASNNRLSGFLKFVIEQELSDRGDQLKESIIGVEVFGRPPDYDVRQDSVVRTEAGKLRARLAQYYAAEGTGQVIIGMPKGSYRPVFLRSEMPLEAGSLADSRKRWSAPPWAIVAVACVVVSLAAVGWWRFQHPTAPIPIAVLPLINLSQDASNDYFADGLTGEIIRNLSIIEGLTVRSQTSSFVFKGQPRNMSEAGKQLAAEYILEGSVLRAGQQLRINAQLVRVRDDFPLWSGRYDRVLTDIFAIQDEISRGIVNSLRLELGRGRRRYETSVEAYDFYLRARAFGTLPAMTGIERSLAPFEQAIAKDPSFAPAYAGLATAHAARSGFDDPVDRASEISKGWTAAEKAIQLDPLLVEAHDALGMMHAREAQWEQAERRFRRAIDLAPGDPLWHYDFATFFLLPLGRIEEALRQLRIAEELDPLSPAVHSFLRVALRSAGRFDEADAHCPKAAVNDQQKSQCVAQALLREGKTDEGIRILEAWWSGNLLGTGARVLGVAYAKAGRRTDAERVAAVVPRPLSKAAIFAALRDKDRTFEALDRMVPLGPVRMGRDVLISPEFALLRGDPRLNALRRKVGLPE